MKGFGDGNGNAAKITPPQISLILNFVKKILEDLKFIVVLTK